MCNLPSHFRPTRTPFELILILGLVTRLPAVKFMGMNVEAAANQIGRASERATVIEKSLLLELPITRSLV